MGAPDQPGEYRVSVSSSRTVRRLFLWCLTIEICIVLADALLNYSHFLPAPSLRKVFNITREDGVGNWFSSLQTLAIALPLWALFWVDREACRRQRQPAIKGWAVLAVFFMYMAFDDATKFHERFGSAFDDWFGFGQHLPTYTWLFTLGPLFVLMGGYCAWFLWRQMPVLALRWRVGAAIALLAVAMALDFIEGIDAMKWPHVVSHFMMSLEEFLEMLGMTCFLTACCLCLLDSVQRAIVDVTE